MSRQKHTFLIEKLTRLHRQIRDRVMQAMRGQQAHAMADLVQETDGDVIFAIDKVSEAVLLDFFERELAPEVSFVLIAEGLGDDGVAVFPAGSDPDAAEYRILVDPIDGTRPLMYDKRSAWILTGIAPNRGAETHLDDIFLALQTEIPTTKQAWADTLWAVQGQPAQAVRENLLTGERQAYTPRPSPATTLDQGFASFVHFFHGSKEIISRIDEMLAQALFGPVQPGRAWTFEDQYMSTGGQIYELATGKDRFLADLRGLIANHARANGEPAGLCCHPYDLCTALIAQAAGVVITGANGTPLTAPLDVTTDVSWIGYANATLQEQVEPALQRILREMGFIL